MNYEKAWKALKANFAVALLHQSESSEKEDKGIKVAALSALMTMKKLEQTYAEEKEEPIL